MKTQDAFSVDKAEDSPGFLLWQVTTLWQRGIKKALEAIGITHPQFVLLASLLWLSGRKGSVTQADLSQHSKIDPMTTSTVMRMLEKKGFVTRQEHQTDTRAKRVTLTAKGLETTKKAIGIIEAFDKEFFKPHARRQAEFNRQLAALLESKQH